MAFVAVPRPVLETTGSAAGMGPAGAAATPAAVIAGVFGADSRQAGFMAAMEESSAADQYP